MEDRRIWLDQIPVEDAADLLLSADTSPSDTQRLESSRQQRQQYTLERILKTHVVDWEAKYVEIARQCNDETRPSGGLFEAMPGFDFLEEEGGHRLREIMSTQSPIPASDRKESGSASNKEKVGTQDALGKEMRLDAFSQLLGFESSRYMLEMAMPGQYKIPKELFDPPTGSEQQETKHPHITGETSNERTRETASTKTSEHRHQMNITPHSTSTSSNKYPVPQTAIRSGRLASQFPIPPTKTDSSISAFNWQTPIIIPPQHKQPFKNDNPMPSSSRAPVTTTTAPSAASTQDSVGGQRARKRRAKKKRNKETSESQHPPPRRPPPPKSGPSVPPPSANENSIPQVLSSGNRARQAHPSIPRAAKSRKKRVPVVVPAPGTERPPAMSPSMPQVATGGNKKIPVVVPASGIARPPTASPSIPQVSPSGSRKPPEVVSTASVTSNNRPPGRRNWLTDHGALSIESVGSEGTQVVFRPNPTGNSMRKRLLGKPEEFDDAYYGTAAPEQSNSHKFIAKEDNCYVLFESGKKTVIGHVKDVHPLIQRYFLTKDSKSHDY